MNQDSNPPVLENLSQSVNDLVAEGGRALASDDESGIVKRNWKADIAHLAPAVRARLMAKYSVTYNGRHYEACGYRYDLLADAVLYAKLRRSTTRGEFAATQYMEAVEKPTPSQHRLMAELHITYTDGFYRFGVYRYERLTDAVNYAQLKWHLPIEAVRHAP